MHLESRDVTPGWRVYATAGGEGRRRGKILVGGGQDHALAQVRSFRQRADDRQRAIGLAPGDDDGQAIIVGGDGQRIERGGAFHRVAGGLALVGAGGHVRPAGGARRGPGL